MYSRVGPTHSGASTLGRARSGAATSATRGSWDSTLSWVQGPVSDLDGCSPDQPVSDLFVAIPQGDAGAGAILLVRDGEALGDLPTEQEVRALAADPAAAGVLPIAVACVNQVAGYTTLAEVNIREAQLLLSGRLGLGVDYVRGRWPGCFRGDQRD